jgi:hypothetical protein
MCMLSTNLVPQWTPFADVLPFVETGVFEILFSMELALARFANVYTKKDALIFFNFFLTSMLLYFFKTHYYYKKYIIKCSCGSYIISR